MDMWVIDQTCLIKLTRVRVGPGKPGMSWNFSVDFPGLESPGKGYWSWKVLEIC